MIVDLGNYEAAADYFTTRFQPERSPFPALATMKDLEAAPPVFDIGRYEKETRGRVDYILFYGGRDSGGDGGKAAEVELCRSRIAGYKLARSGRLGNLRLYERTSAAARGGQ